MLRKPAAGENSTPKYGGKKMGNLAPAYFPTNTLDMEQASVHTLAMKKNRTLIAINLILLCAIPILPGHSFPQVIDGSANPSAFSDRDALGALFTVIRTKPAPAWDLDTRLKFLQDGGLKREEALGLIRAADRWFAEIGPLDATINALKAQQAGKQLDKEWQAKADQVANQKLSRLDSNLADVRLSLAVDGNERLVSMLQSVKRGMKAHVIGTVPPPPQTPHH